MAYPMTFPSSATTELDAGSRPKLDLLQHPEYFGFAEWVGHDNFPIEDMTPVFVKEQLQVRCFPEFQRRSPQNYSTGFFVSTVDKFAASYGSWEIRAKLPFQVPASMSIGLLNSHCTIPSCPPDAGRPVTFTQMDLSPGKDIAFEVAEWDNVKGKSKMANITAKSIPMEDDDGRFHTYVINWFPAQLEWIVDGELAAQYFGPGISEEKMVFHVDAHCPRNNSVLLNEDRGFIISSVVYRPMMTFGAARFSSSQAPGPTHTQMTTPRAYGVESETVQIEATSPATSGRTNSPTADRSMFEIISSAAKDIGLAAVHKERSMADPAQPKFEKGPSDRKLL